MNTCLCFYLKLEFVFKVHIFWEGHKIFFAKSSPYFWLTLDRTKVTWRFHKILWPSQNIWTLMKRCGELSSSCYCVKINPVLILEVHIWPFLIWPSVAHLAQCSRSKKRFFIFEYFWVFWNLDPLFTNWLLKLMSAF